MVATDYLLLQSDRTDHLNPEEVNSSSGVLVPFCGGK